MRDARRGWCRVLAIAAALGAPAGHASEAAQPPGGHDLAKVEKIEKFVGSAAARNLLARNGFVVTGTQFKQIFSAYIGGRLPKFITADSAWHTEVRGRSWM